MAFLSKQALRDLNFRSIGENVRISEKASFYNCAQIEIGSNVRIDDFCILSAGLGGIKLNNFIHIGAFSSLIGAGRITLSDFSNLSSRVSIYSSSDDYSGSSLTNPMIPDEFKSVDHREVIIGKHVIIGSGSVILPGVILDDGVSIGALSLVNQSCARFQIYAGIPAKLIKPRSSKLLDLENIFLAKK